ncbi:MAG: UDP-N-acetylglucosamine--N-acetylmuramyl-(pentapeptide) pyrophosphoryl-undecaprenol N-acetylglucosamine transferase [Phycisphaerae bacterium]
MTAPLVAFAGGGSGGHLYPALAIAEAFRASLPGVRFVFFGTRRSIDQRILAEKRCDLVQQSLMGLSRSPWRWPQIFLGLHRSSRDCRVRFYDDQPIAVIGTGGLASVPAVREAARAGIPTAIFNPDAVPGRANRFLARVADLVFTQFEETADRWPRAANVVISGCPVRPAFNRADRDSAVHRLGLNPARKTLLVTGASQGARTLNQAVLANLDYLESLFDWQILHLTGEPDFEEVRDAYAGRPIRAKVWPFTTHMAEALAAADLVIARAGASTLAEITAVGRASILLPYPFHRDAHQLANARCLVRASAARIVRDAVDPAVNGPALHAALEQLVRDEQTRQAMASAARQIGRGQAAKVIANRVIALGRSRGTLVRPESLKAV